MGYSTYLKLGKNLFGKIASNRRNYRQYCNIVKDWSRRLNQTSCSKIQVDTVAKSVVRKNGFEKESLETLQTTEFIEAVKPKIALIGVGKNNLFNHPSEITLKTLENNNIKIYRTDKNGEITIKVNKNGKYKIKEKINY